MIIDLVSGLLITVIVSVFGVAATLFGVWVGHRLTGAHWVEWANGMAERAGCAHEATAWRTDRPAGAWCRQR